MIDAILTNTMLPTMSRHFLTELMDGHAINRVQVGVDNADFKYVYE
jgi:type VI secretion system protein VasG